MTYLDIIQIYNLSMGYDLNDIEKIIDHADIDSRIDKDVLAGSLLEECGAMNSLYNTSVTFKYYSDLFFKKNKWSITKLLDTLELKYDPLKNKSNEWTETSTINQELTTEEDSTQNKTKDNTGTQTTEFDDTETNTISAMNAGEYQPDTQSISDSNNTRTDELTETTETVNDINKNELLEWDETDVHTESGTNNITYQELIEKERKIAEFSIYTWIAKKYARELFLLVY